MEGLNNILVVSMGSKHCLRAVQMGISIARKYDAKLFIVHISYNPFGLEGWNLPLSSRKTLQEEFAEMTLKEKKILDEYIISEDLTGLSIEQTEVEGNPKDEIPKLIEKKDIDLLVMVAHEQEHIEHFISGRDIHDLVRKMPCSIFLVRRELEFKKFNV